MHDQIANCGCVYHAEEGIPCVHDLQLRARSVFKEALDACPARHELIVLEECGWEEECPSDGMWHFVHPDYPNVMVDWTPNREPVAHETRMNAWRYKRKV